ncbi:MAG: right-handed parallel beta-helix repeat-containing protein [Propionibacteriaceae bacterium]|jgi:hypothetical protein|nr:right-handed parallel beta-helix repeat-containing protein [Propionibacteriaceae bacterium]
MTTYHVSPAGLDHNDGSEDSPLRTINRAAALAEPGDTVLVHEGLYREWVEPIRGGRSARNRITYAAAPGEKAVISGAEPVSGWVAESDDVWRVEVDNTLFGDFNPFAQLIEGDWLDRRDGSGPRHLGDVYLDGRSFYEVDSRDDLSSAGWSEKVDQWSGIMSPVVEPDQTRFTWYAEVAPETTTIWATFPGVDPNEHLTEINVRRSVFWPREHHVDFITVRGFELAQAACPWTPPTADQPGLIGPNWAMGWIIEDCDIHDAKCSAVSLGKERSTGHNYAAERGDKPGYQYQLESVFSARQIGWDREHIGSHIVRRNHIHHCGQNGVVGHLGAVFSTIEGNHIHDIATKREFYGYEIGGIKLHAAIDTQIIGNRIDHCTLGTWLDWQTQGTRISRNIYYANNRDIFIEVSHGPYVVDHNIFGSKASLELFSQGGALVNNIICGAVRLEPVLDRATPYHHPHTTQVAGYSFIFGGDDRWIGNLFLGGTVEEAYEEGNDGYKHSTFGTAVYDEHPGSFDEYGKRTRALEGDQQRFYRVLQPALLSDNTFAAGAPVGANEVNPRVVEESVAVSIVEDGETVSLLVEGPASLAEGYAGVVTTADLPPVRVAAADFDALDGSDLLLDHDLLGQLKEIGKLYPAGPLAAFTPGEKTRIWSGVNAY